MSDNATLDRIIEEVRHIAADHPAHVYQPPDGEGSPCSYLTSLDHPGQGCIMGQALIHIGVSPEALEAVEGDGIGTAIKELGLKPEQSDLAEDGTWAHDHMKARWLNWVQNKQDNGATWSAAVKDADAMYPGVAR